MCVCVYVCMWVCVCEYVGIAEGQPRKFPMG